MVVNHIGSFYLIPSLHIDNHYHTNADNEKVLLASSLAISFLNYGLCLGFIKRDVEKWF
jgi:gentisate 1,2-dioxygenase